MTSKVISTLAVAANFNARHAKASQGDFNKK
jgi:hypothetical protein